MNILKTPQQLLMEEAGMAPASPGLLHTPRQMLMQESGIVPKMAEGGQPPQQPQMSPQDMMAMMLAYFGMHALPPDAPVPADARSLL